MPYDAVTEAGETEVIAGVASMLVTTIVLFGAAKLMLATERVPVGACTVLFGVVAALIAGAALDVFLRARPLLDVRTGGVAAAFAVTSITMWLVYFGLLGLLDGIEWQAEIWLGAVVLNGFAAYAVAATPSLDYEQASVGQGSEP